MGIAGSIRSRMPQGARDNAFLRFFARLLILFRHRDRVREAPGPSWRYLIHSRETSNFLYEIENLDELIGATSAVLGIDEAAAWGLLEELREDRSLLDELSASLAANPRRDNKACVGYRYSTYIMARVVRPRVIAEVGVHDGVQSAILLRALERNSEEGFAGRLIGFDQTEEAGWLVPDRLRGGFELVVGDVAETFAPALAGEALEFMAQDVAGDWDGTPRLYDQAIEVAPGHLAIFGEVGQTDTLQRVAEEHGGIYGGFTERSTDHFWPGDPRGLAAIPGTTPAA